MTCTGIPGDADRIRIGIECTVAGRSAWGRPHYRVAPYPASDGVARNSFLPVAVAITPPAGLPVQSAIVEFGYAENGNPESFYCTSRQETCVAASSAVNQAVPFYFEQSEQYSGVPCATGCTVTAPALSQRVVYYRWKYLGNSGQVIGSSQVHVVVTP